MTRSDLSTAARRIGHICEVAIDDRALRRQAIEEVRRVVPFRAFAWLLTDPVTAVGAAPLAEVPWLAELPRQIRLKYLTPVNRWSALDGAVASLYSATAGDLSQSLVWRELLTRYGIGDVASVVFRDRFGCWGFLELWRDETHAAFAPDELAFLRDGAPVFTAALRTRVCATFADASTGNSAVTGPVVLLMSADLQVRAQTPETQNFLSVLLPPAEDGAPIPASAYNVAAQLLAVEAGVDDSAPSARVHLAGGTWLTLRAARLGDVGDPVERDIAVTIEPTAAASRVDLFTRAFGMSPRETELMSQLVAGRNSREIAEAMSLSEHTVQDHLKSIFAKTKASSRRALLSRAVGS